MKNKYLKRAHFSATKFRLIIKSFSEDQTTVQAAEISGLSRRTVTDVYQKLRLRLSAKIDQINAERRLLLNSSWLHNAGNIISGIKINQIVKAGRSVLTENFWEFTKKRLEKFKGVRQEKYLLHIKESRFRWLKTSTEIYKYLLEELRDNPLS